MYLKIEESSQELSLLLANTVCASFRIEMDDDLISLPCRLWGKLSCRGWDRNHRSVEFTGALKMSKFLGDEHYFLFKLEILNKSINTWAAFLFSICPSTLGV